MALAQVLGVLAYAVIWTGFAFALLKRRYRSTSSRALVSLALGVGWSSHLLLLSSLGLLNHEPAFLLLNMGIAFAVIGGGAWVFLSSRARNDSNGERD